jgi:antitoxin (DNA-binding transcriptional repressor) of toxin-antitoxin stability system
MRRVAAGESIAVTDRGVVIGVINPPPTGTLREQLIASGELIPGRRGPLPEPLPGKPGFSASAELQRMRDEERW